MVPIGGIINWSGALLDIPDGYQECDGTNGTPDLRDKFVIGACGSKPVDATVGDINHTHSLSSTQTTDVTSGIGIVESGNTGSSGSLPPWYSLAYIQRMA